jgi:hypothetical protein
MEDASCWRFAGAGFLGTPVAVSMVLGAVVKPDHPAVELPFELMPGVVAQIQAGENNNGRWHRCKPGCGREDF